MEYICCNCKKVKETKNIYFLKESRTIYPICDKCISGKEIVIVETITTEKQKFLIT